MATEPTSQTAQAPEPSEAVAALRKGLTDDEWRRIKRRRFLNKLYPYLFMLPALIMVFTVFVYPILYGVNRSMSIQPLGGLGDSEFVGFAVYAELFQRPAFWNSMTRSLIFVGGTIFGGVLLSMIFALTLYHTPFFKRTFRAVSLIPWLVSGVATAWMFRFVFDSTSGMVNRITGLVGYEPGTWLGHPIRAMYVIIIANLWGLVPFGTLLLLAGLQMINHEVFEAGKVDGANGRQLFWFVTLAELKAHVGVVLVVFSFAAWNTFDLVLAMTEGGPMGATEVLGVYMFKRAFRALQFSEGAALMVMILLINAVLSIGYLFWLREED